MEITFADGIFGTALGPHGEIRISGLRLAWLKDEVILRPVMPLGRVAPATFLSIPLRELPKVVHALCRVLGQATPPAS